jgi:glucose/arabinose dehydrogenase
MDTPSGEVKGDEVKVDDVDAVKGESSSENISSVKKFVPFIVLGIVLMIVVIVVGFVFGGGSRRASPVATNVSITASPVPSKIDRSVVAIEVLTENLDTPWGIAILPDGEMLVTERPGRVRLVNRDGSLQYNPAVVISNVKEEGEGGLLGIALHPGAPPRAIRIFWAISMFICIIRMGFRLIDCRMIHITGWCV